VEACFESVTLVLGGARSGKSLYAERLVTARQPPWVHVATAQAFDDEMRARIAIHQTRRGENWVLVEEPLDLAGAVASAGQRPVLVDCLTLWLTNLMLGGQDIPAAIGALDRTLRERRTMTVLVSNEVGLGIVPDNALARRFRDEAGRLNQHLAASAASVLFMVAGLPMRLK
jgi:adenosylcobinamide kinase/adenosylcobinamide-phosphate guanylyltransferase